MVRSLGSSCLDTGVKCNTDPFLPPDSPQEKAVLLTCSLTSLPSHFALARNTFLPLTGCTPIQSLQAELSAGMLTFSNLSFNVFCIISLGFPPPSHSGFHHPILLEDMFPSCRLFPSKTTFLGCITFYSPFYFRRAPSMVQLLFSNMVFR